MSLAPSFAAWAVIPFNEEWVLTNINIGLLYILMITSLSVYGVIIAGWASNSNIRSWVQCVLPRKAFPTRLP